MKKMILLALAAGTTMAIASTGTITRYSCELVKTYDMKSETTKFIVDKETGKFSIEGKVLYVGSSNTIYKTYFVREDTNKHGLKYQIYRSKDEIMEVAMFPAQKRALLFAGDTALTYEDCKKVK